MFRRAKDFRSIVYKQAGYKLYGNEIILNQKYRFKFFFSRPWEGNVKRIILKRSPLGEYYVVIVTDAVASPIRKSHDGASVGIDFGLKTFYYHKYTLSKSPKIGFLVIYKALFVNTRVKEKGQAMRGKFEIFA